MPKQPAAETEKLYTQTELLEMGWTKTMIAKLLPAPTLKRNYMYPHSAPIKLYQPETVSAVMQTPEFLEAKAKADKRKAAAKKAAETKTEKLIAEMRDVYHSISVTVLPDDVLREYVCDERDSYAFDHCLDCDPAESAPDETMNRWIVNYIRHNLVEYYDKSLYYLDGKTGKREAYARFKSDVLYKIAEAYPKYAEECRRQMNVIY